MSMTYSRLPHDEMDIPSASYQRYKRPIKPYPSLAPLMQDPRFTPSLSQSLPEDTQQFFPPDPSSSHSFLHQPRPSYSRISRGTMGRNRKFRASIGKRNPISRNIPTYHKIRLIDSRNISSNQTPLHAINVPRKPRAWRKGYKSPSRTGFRHYLAILWRILFRRRSSFIVPRLRINPRISYNTRQQTSVVYDLRFDPTSGGSNLQFLSLNPELTAINLFQWATSPPTNRLMLWHPKLPWYLKVRQTNATGITVQDVLFGIFQQLRRPITQHEYYSEEVTHQDRELYSSAFEDRCAGDIDEILKGIRRIDFLGREVFFVGLKPSKDGMLEIKTTTHLRRWMTLD
jgi:hypothetical protein